MDYAINLKQPRGETMENVHSTDIQAQEQRLEVHIREFGSVTTVKARHELDIVSPAARVHSLRHRRGLNIITVWVTEINPGGGEHRFAKYILQEGEYNGHKLAA
jgi:hypothetical protein